MPPAPLDPLPGARRLPSSAPPSTSSRLVEEVAVADAPASPAPEGRWELLDAVRIVAAASVVWHHAMTGTPWMGIGRFSVPFFAAAAAFFAVRHASRRPDEPLVQFVLARGSRILGPFFAWSIVYTLVRQITSLFLPVVTPVSFEWWRFYTGPTHHLWFLPFVFVVCVVAALTGLVAQRSRASAVAIVAACVGGAIAIAVYDFSGWEAEHLYAPRMWVEASPAALLGLAYAVAWFHVPQLRITPRASYGLVTILATAWIVALGGGRYVPLATAAGVGALLCALSSRRPAWLPDLRGLGELALGVYLSHVLFSQGLKDFFRLTMGWDDGGPGLLLFALTLPTALVFTCWARRRGLSWLAGT
ncbi:MAG: acyltransferase family protein [Lacipirellulaceae bacterium]